MEEFVPTPYFNVTIYNQRPKAPPVIVVGKQHKWCTLPISEEKVDLFTTPRWQPRWLKDYLFLRDGEYPIKKKAYYDMILSWLAFALGNYA